MDYKPELLKENFVCPHCKIGTQHHWRFLASQSIPELEGQSIWYSDHSFLEHFKVSKCLNCSGPVIWFKDKIVFPTVLSEQPDPHSDMPKEISEIYREAASISSL